LLIYTTRSFAPLPSSIKIALRLIVHDTYGKVGNLFHPETAAEQKYEHGTVTETLHNVKKAIHLLVS